MSIDLIKENGSTLKKKKKKKARSILYPAKTITGVGYFIALLANTAPQANYLLHRLELAAGGIGLYVNADKTECMSFIQGGAISTLNGGPLKLVDKFMYLGSSVSSTESDIKMYLAKAWIAIDWLSIIWKLDLSDKTKRDFFPPATVSILLYECTIWTLTKRTEKKLHRNCTSRLRAILNKSWKQHFTKQQLYSHLPPNFKTIQIK